MVTDPNGPSFCARHPFCRWNSTNVAATCAAAGAQPRAFAAWAEKELHVHTKSGGRQCGSCASVASMLNLALRRRAENPDRAALGSGTPDALLTAAEKQQRLDAACARA